MKTSLKAILLVVAVSVSITPARACGVGGLLFMLLNPCRPPPPMAWNKVGQRPGEFATTRYQCLRENRVQSTYGVGSNGSSSFSSGVIVDDQLFGACMNAHGWYLQRVQQR